MMNRHVNRVFDLSGFCMNELCFHFNKCLKKFCYYEDLFCIAASVDVDFSINPDCRTGTIVANKVKFHDSITTGFFVVAGIVEIKDSGLPLGAH